MNNIIKTFGCRLNIFETEVIKNFITKNKMKNVSVLNTCAVTKEAEKKSQREIKKIKNKNKNSFLIVTGCASQLKPETFEQMNEVDLVLGNQEKLISKNWLKINSILEDKKKKYNSKLVSNIMEENRKLYENNTSNWDAFGGSNQRKKFNIKGEKYITILNLLDKFNQ